MWITNVCFLKTSDSVLLAMKKRGFGVGKWNGVGGKVKGGETSAAAARREIEEEIGVKVLEKDLKNMGLIKFRFDGFADWENNMTVYIVRKWSGEPGESEEMSPRWYKFTEIPFDLMWPDDKYWLPLVLSGKKLDAEFHFLSDGKTLKSKKIKVRSLG